MTNRLICPATPEALVEALTALVGGADLVVCGLDPARQANDWPDEALPPSFAGVVVATSGSTGRPKWVMLSRRALIRAAQMTHERLGGPADWVNPLPAHYVAGLMTIVRAVVGGRSYLAVSPDLSDLPDSDGYLSVVPAQLHRCLDDPILTGQLSGFQAVLVGGARLDEGLQARAIAAGVRVIATYGMSETCGGVVYDGLPLPGVTINLDDDSRIGLTTPTLFDGYVGEPDLSAAVRQGSTFYTNDRGVLVEGRLHVLGRIDEVVKSGGVSVDLAGLQGLADQFFGDQVAVFAVPDPIWGSRIVVASTGPSWPTINDSLAEIVDSAARPRGFLALDRLPRLASGKIDRTSLTERWRNNGELD